MSTAIEIVDGDEQALNASEAADWMVDHKDWLDRHTAEADIEEGRLKTLALDLLRGDKKLQKCTKASILHSIVEYFNSGLDIEHDEAYFVPSYSSKRNRYECDFRISYRGKIKLAEQHPKIRKIEYDAVREEDLLEYESTVEDLHFRYVPAHEKSHPFTESEIVGFYALARDPDRHVLDVELMSRGQVEEIRDNYSNSTAWDSEFGEMGKKTVVHRFLKPFDKSSDRVVSAEVKSEGIEPETDISGLRNKLESSGSNHKSHVEVAASSVDVEPEETPEDGLEEDLETPEDDDGDPESLERRDGEPDVYNLENPRGPGDRAPDRGKPAASKEHAPSDVKPSTTEPEAGKSRDLNGTDEKSSVSDPAQIRPAEATKSVFSLLKADLDVSSRLARSTMNFLAYQISGYDVVRWEDLKDSKKVDFAFKLEGSSTAQVVRRRLESALGKIWGPVLGREDFDDQKKSTENMLSLVHNNHTSLQTLD